MLKPFLKDSAVYGVATMLSRGIQIAMVPVYTRVLAPADYGAIDLMLVVAAFALPILTLQITAGMGRSLADAGDAERDAIVSTAVTFTALTALVMAAFAVGAPSLGASWIDVDPAMFRIGGLAIAAQVSSNTLLEVLRWELRPFAYAAVSVLFTAVSTGVAVWVVVGRDGGAIGVMDGQLAGYAVAVAAAAWLARRRIRLRLDGARLREMLAFSGPLVLPALFFSISTFTDRIGINAVLGKADVGVFGIGARVATTVGLITAAFAAAVEPLILGRYKEAETPAAVARLTRFFLVLVLPMVIGLGVFAREVVWLLVPAAYHAGADVIAPLALAAVLAGATMFAPGLAIAKRTRRIAAIVIATSMLNIGLNALLIPWIGIPGAATATLISAAAVLAINVAASQASYPVPHAWARLAAAAAITAAALVGGYAIQRGGLGHAGAIAVEAATWLVACAALVPALLDRHDLRIARDRLRALTARGGDRAAPAAAP